MKQVTKNILTIITFSVMILPSVKAMLIRPIAPVAYRPFNSPMQNSSYSSHYSSSLPHLNLKSARSYHSYNRDRDTLQATQEKITLFFKCLSVATAAYLLYENQFPDEEKEGRRLLQNHRLHQENKSEQLIQEWEKGLKRWKKWNDSSLELIDSNFTSQDHLKYVEALVGGGKSVADEWQKNFEDKISNEFKRIKEEGNVTNEEWQEFLAFRQRCREKNPVSKPLSFFRKLQHHLAKIPLSSFNTLSEEEKFWIQHQINPESLHFVEFAQVPASVCNAKQKIQDSQTKKEVTNLLDLPQEWEIINKYGYAADNIDDERFIPTIRLHNLAHFRHNDFLIYHYLHQLMLKKITDFIQTDSYTSMYEKGNEASRDQFYSMVRVARTLTSRLGAIQELRADQAYILHDKKNAENARLYWCSYIPDKESQLFSIDQPTAYRRCDTIQAIQHQLALEEKLHKNRVGNGVSER